MIEIIGIRFRNAGKIYYFAVASWSSKNDEVIGDLSKEVYARPLASRH